MFGFNKNDGTTSISYCAECQKDFSENEKCYYTWYENNVFCTDCKKIMDGRVDPSYLDWSERVYKK